MTSGTWLMKRTGWDWPSSSTSSTTISAPTAITWTSSPPFYFSNRHKTLWGPAVNLDGEQSDQVRSFFFENALCWLSEYHLDGLRLDATHHLFDESPRHFLAELAALVRESIRDRSVLLFAEDPRNLAVMVRAKSEGGWGLDGLWSDDFHHELRRYLVGDSDGAFRDFRGSLADLARTINRGWLFCGSYSIHRGCVRGTDPAGLEPHRFIFYLQNHDRIGNRAMGERLNHQLDPATYRAASALLLTAPATPLLHRSQRRAGPARQGGQAPRVPALRSLRRSRRAGKDSRLPVRADLPRLQDRLGRARSRAACRNAQALSGPASAAADGARAFLLTTG